MKCPHCEYEHNPYGSYNHKTGEYGDKVMGECGGFYEHPVQMEREVDWQTDRLRLHACPSCMKTFVEGL